MKFPRPVMSLPEIHREMGIPERKLRNIAHEKEQKCAFRMNLNGRGKIMFDTDKLAKRLEKGFVR